MFQSVRAIVKVFGVVQVEVPKAVHLVGREVRVLTWKVCRKNTKRGCKQHAKLFCVFQWNIAEQELTKNVIEIDTLSDVVGVYMDVCIWCVYSHRV